ncbi:MAG: MaoC/PaaZ C-terminal domain-containing protein [Anaerolineales bacterium]|nr:MaoC/PaaZ C-terminal domain-containing protein [Anaerolineales bacterium]
MNPPMRGLYFEEFEVGQRVYSPGRTVTEADVLAFAGLSGDFNTIHTDAEFAQGTPFGERVAHGLLGLSIASGLAVRTGVMEGTVIAFREITDWKFSLPVYFGDTIHIVIEVVEKKALPRLGGGSLLLAVDVQNQENKTVMRGSWNVLVKSKPEEG